MKTHLAGKNLLFAEMIVVILFFSLAAAACVTLFAQARQDSDTARDLTNAVIIAQNIAETFKAGADVENLTTDDGLDFRRIITESDGVERMYITVHRDDSVIFELTVARLSRAEL
jgi:Tfp pilus assembly protein PilV